MQQILARIRLLGIYALILLPILVYGAVQALQSTNNSPIDWVDNSFAERRQYDQFVEMFGPGDSILVSWPACHWTDERLDTLIDILRSGPQFCDAKEQSYFHSVVCGRETLLRMTPEAESTFEQFSSVESLETESASVVAESVDRSKMPLDVAIQRLKGTLIGQDGRLTCVICTLNAAGLAIRANLVDELKRVIRKTCQVADKELHLAGPVIDGLTVDEASHRSLTQFALPSTVVIFLICLWSLKSLILATIVFATSAICQCAILAIIYYSGERLSALLIILPPLVQVLSVSGGIHLMNYYFNSLETMEPREAAINAFRLGWLPSLLSLGTTAMGTASLMISGLQPIRLFGIYGTIGILLAAGLMLSVIPCSMMLLGTKQFGQVRRQMRENQESDHDNPVASSRCGWGILATLLQRWNAVALVLLFGALITAGFGLPHVRTSVRIETLFEPASRILADYRWLEQQIGPLVPIDVLLTFSDSCRLNDRQKMDLIWKVDHELKAQQHVKSTTSALTFFPPLPAMRDAPMAFRSAALNKAIGSARPAFESMAMMSRNSDGEVWRITAHVSALAPLDYGQVLRELQQTIDTRLKKLPTNATDGLEVSTSGIMPLVHAIQGQLLSDLFHSLMSALVVITITMTIAEAGFLNGMVSMVSNLFPIVIAFGLMGWLQHPMDIGSVMTASVALGIAVDDTLHFLTFFRRTLNQPEGTQYSAVLSAYRHCGPAMIQTSLSCGLGLLVFVFSDFVPTSRFAMLITLLLMLALIGDLLLLPAMLLSPCGRLFRNQPESEDGACDQ
jgi:predicted RND superfamily exporter protein